MKGFLTENDLVDAEVKFSANRSGNPHVLHGLCDVDTDGDRLVIVERGGPDAKLAIYEKRVGARPVRMSIGRDWMDVRDLRLCGGWVTFTRVKHDPASAEPRRSAFEIRSKPDHVSVELCILDIQTQQTICIPDVKAAHCVR